MKSGDKNFAFDIWIFDNCNSSIVCCRIQTVRSKVTMAKALELLYT